MNTFLKETQVSLGKCLHVRVGSLSFWVYNADNEWFTAYEYEGETSNRFQLLTIGEKPSDKNWQRWAVPANSGSLSFEPVMPDRAVVIRPEFPLQIPPGHNAQFFIGIPVWLRVLAGGDKKIVIFEQPTVKLSNTWFGEMESGELTYSLKSAVRSDWQSFETFPHKAICPVHVKNRSDDILDFKRACIQVKHLAVYSGERYLWTNKIIIKFVGGDNFSDLHIKKDAPCFETIHYKLCSSKEKSDSNLVINTFRSLTHFHWFQN